MIGNLLSHDPVRPDVRKDDPAFAAVVDRTFARLGETRRILRTYSAWFLDRLPTGERLGRPTAPQLETIFHTQACRRSEEAGRADHAVGDRHPSGAAPLAEPPPCGRRNPKRPRTDPS